MAPMTDGSKKPMSNRVKVQYMCSFLTISNKCAIMSFRSNMYALISVSIEGPIYVQSRQ